MQIRQLDIRHFRGFQSLTIKPSGHVLLAGQPRAGRSDVVEALTRVLDPDSTRSTLVGDLDFFSRDTSKRAEVEVVAGDLGEELEQRFFDQIDFWDTSTRSLLPPTGPGEQAPVSSEPVVRLCYRAEWLEDEHVATHWVDFPKFSEPESGDFSRVPRPDRVALPFGRLGLSGTPLRLNPRSAFRKILSMVEGDDFPETLEQLIEDIRSVSGQLTDSSQVQAALLAVFGDVALPLRLGDHPPGDLVSFVPDDGSVSSLLRSFSSSVDLGDEVGRLPLSRHGSTTQSMIATGEALAATKNGVDVLVIDDLGEGMDAAGASFAAQILRESTSQSWVSTRRPSVAEAFRTSEIVRLTRAEDSQRSAFQGTEPTTKAERIAARHTTLQLLPALAARALIVVEGPHDHAAYRALAAKLFEEEGVHPPGAHGIHVIHAAAADSSGGSGAIPRLAEAAKALGFRVVSVIDHDGANEQTAAELDANLNAADAVVRLPHRTAVERALVAGLPSTTLRDALVELNSAFGLSIDAAATADPDLEDLAVRALKSSGGLHAQFVQALPFKRSPTIAREVLQISLKCALGRLDGHQQL